MRLTRKNILYFYAIVLIIIVLLVRYVDAIDTVRGICIFGIVVIATFAVKKLRSTSGGEKK